MDTTEIFEKLCGKIYPYGATEIDNERYSNLTNYDQMLEYLIYRLYECAKFKNDNRFSCNNIGNSAYNILLTNKETIENLLNDLEED